LNHKIYHYIGILFLNLLNIRRIEPCDNAIHLLFCFILFLIKNAQWALKDMTFNYIVFQICWGCRHKGNSLIVSMITLVFLFFIFWTQSWLNHTTLHYIGLYVLSSSNHKGDWTVRPCITLVFLYFDFSNHKKDWGIRPCIILVL
jgi:hypothetical protein